MGTGKSGCYFKTKGSGRIVGSFAQVHSDEGTFKTSQVRVNGKVVKQLRLESGGHGQAGMDLLDKYNIKYNVVKTLPNGVRIGNVPNHDKKSKRTGTNQTWFPKSWTAKDIKQAGEHVAGLKSNRHIPDGKTIYGTWKGVRVGVIRTNGSIATVFPDSNQGPALRRRK